MNAEGAKPGEAAASSGQESHPGGHLRRSPAGQGGTAGMRGTAQPPGGGRRRRQDAIFRLKEDERLTAPSHRPLISFPPGAPVCAPLSAPVPLQDPMSCRRQVCTTRGVPGPGQPAVGTEATGPRPSAVSGQRRRRWARAGLDFRPHRPAGSGSGGCGPAGPAVRNSAPPLPWDPPFEPGDPRSPAGPPSSAKGRFSKSSPGPGGSFFFFFGVQLADM